jgi:two-component system, OmpR family, phosphate regulon sensor histidine kinase PhoR
MDYQIDQFQRSQRSQRRRALRRSPLGALVSVAARRQTYYNLAYLITAFPLGLVYFLLFVVGISVGVSTAIIGIGLVLLAVVMLGWWGCAVFERELTMWWLNVRIGPMSTPAPQGLSGWRRFLRLLRNPVTWKSLAYLLLKFPFGLISFTVTITLLSLALGLILSPVEFVTSLALNGNDGNADGQISLRPGFGITISGGNNALFALLTLALTIVGVLLLFGSLHIFNGLAFIWGKFSRLMLGTSDTSVRLAEARASVARERTRAERADQSRRELIVNVSHELRTPIANISGHVETLLMANGQDGQQIDEQTSRHYLEIVSREAERLSSLIDDLLALARADANELKLDVRPIAVRDVVEEVYQSLAPLARRDRQVTLVRTIPPDLPLALADRDRLMQVLLNLARNAITYTPAGGIVSLVLSQTADRRLRITVADTGIGIAPDELDRIFDRFYRTDASRSRSSGGFGLGLSIARDLVQAMGGSLSATSAPGEGSQFHIELRPA